MPHTYTWDKLAKNSIRLNPNSRGPNYPATPKFELLMVIPYIGTKSVLVKLQAWGVTQNNLHQVTLLFQDCEILTGEQNLSLIEYFKVDYQNETYWVKKFDKLKNPMSNRCTCFTGNTKILLADGSIKTFKELENTANFEIVAYNEKIDKFEIVKAYNCEKKRENAELLRITLDNGKIIDCTPDHRFLTREDGWIQAQDLKIGESLRALYLDKHNFKRLLPNGKNQKIKKHEVKKKFYVYVYLDPRYPGKYNYPSCSFSFKPIYVGKGTSNRCFNHLNTNLNDRFHNTVRKLVEAGTPPIILKQAINLEEEVAYKIEQKLTNEIGLLIEEKGPLLNWRHEGHYCLKTSQRHLEKQALKEALLNHKVVSIEKLENQDVYCLSAEYLGNFIVDTSDNSESNIFSGVVVENCADYFFNAAWYNYYNGNCLYGPAPKPYQKKMNRPRRNQLGIPIICKHIYNAWGFLKQQGFTKN